MKYNYIKHLFTALLLLCATVATAHDFEVGGIYYNITAATNKTVAVTYRGSSYNEYSNEYTGSVTIPESVTYNGNTYSVTSIGSYAFEDCWRLTSVVIPNSVTSIGEYAFYGCSGLTSIEIPNSVTSIGRGAFSGTPWYETWCNNQQDGMAYIGQVLYEYIGSMPENTSIVIKEGTLSIAGGAFERCSGLTSIVIPNSVTSIGYETFSYCSGLTSIVIPNSVTSIGYRAFDGCSGLTSVVIGNSVTSIGYGAFYGCTALTSIVIPNNVTSIGDYAFRDCYRLTSIEIPNSVTSIGNYAFYGCSGLKTVINFSNLTFSKGSNSNGYVAYYADKVYNLSDGFVVGDFVLGKVDGVNTLVGYLGNATELTLPADYKEENYVIGANVFEDNTTITSVVIPNSVTSIGASAFEGCANIENLYISNSLESIGEKAFAGCEKIMDIKIGLEKPIRGAANVFADAVYDNAILYVPIGTKSLYEKREPWNLFFYVVEMDFTGINEVKAENGKVEGVYYDLSGRAVENPANGIYILDGHKVIVK